MNVSCRSIGTEHDWGLWRKATQEPGRQKRTCRKCGAAEYRRPAVQLRKFTKRKSATGKPYPQCQHVAGGKQCEKPVYADGRCWEHQSKSSGR